MTSRVLASDLPFTSPYASDASTTLLGRYLSFGLGLVTDKIETPGVLDGAGAWEHPVV